MNNWKVGDAFMDSQNTTYVILSILDRECEYLSINNPDGTCPSLVVRLLCTLDYYILEGLIRRIGNVRAGW